LPAGDPGLTRRWWSWTWTASTPGQASSPTPGAPEPAPQPDEEESPADEPELGEPNAEYEYEIGLTGDLIGLINPMRPLRADQLPLTVADLVGNMGGHPITKDSGFAIKVCKK
jgi:hypothetical protein